MTTLNNRLHQTKSRLDAWVERYNGTHFLDEDPIQIPHRFESEEDIEIASFFTATFAWGQRKTIIKKSDELMHMFGQEPHRFILDASDREISALAHFKHRTFNFVDLQGFIAVLRTIYNEKEGLRSFFSSEENCVQKGLNRLHKHFVGHESFAHRSAKHISNPMKNSACKRLNMMLRWLVRKDAKGVDFGIWTHIPMSDLIIPLDVHVHRTAIEFELTKSKKPNWTTAVEITYMLKQFNALDPVVYDFALFAHAASNN